MRLSAGYTAKLLGAAARLALRNSTCPSGCPPAVSFNCICFWSACNDFVLFVTSW